MKVLGHQGSPDGLIKNDPDLGVGSPPHIFFSCEWKPLFSSENRLTQYYNNHLTYRILTWLGKIGTCFNLKRHRWWRHDSLIVIANDDLFVILVNFCDYISLNRFIWTLIRTLNWVFFHWSKLTKVLLTKIMDPCPHQETQDPSDRPNTHLTDRAKPTWFE